MICVLDVLAGPAAGKRIWLKENQCVEIGRLSTVDFPIPTDNFMSRRHLLIDSTENSFRVRDVGSANGTFLNNQRVEVEKLQPGDVIRAGNSSFAVSILDVGENPHKLDGTSFGKTILEVPADSPPEPTRTVDFSSQSQEVSLDQTMRFSVASTGPDSEPSEPSFLENLGSRKSIVTRSSKIVEDIPSFDKANKNDLQNWLDGAFRKTNSPRLFELNDDFDSPLGRYCGVLDAIASTRWIHLIFNHSQLDAGALGAISTHGGDWQFKKLSQSLFIVSQHRSSSLWSVVESMLKQDAMVCLISDHSLSPEALSGFANSFGFPSLFSRHLTIPNSELSNYLIANKIESVYELDRIQRVGLLH